MTTQTIPAVTTAPAAARPQYREHESAPIWMRALGGVLLVAGAALSAAVLDWPGDAPEAALIVPGVVAIVVGALLLLARSGIAVGASGVVLHFRPLPPRRIPRDRIVLVRLVEADAGRHGGLGLRVGRGRRSLRLSAGLGVEILDDAGRVTFVRTRAPESLFRALAGRPVALDQRDRERIG